MFPIIDRKRTGIRLRRIMDERGLSVKAVQQYLELGSVQSVYHWLNGLSMPTIDNLVVLAELFEVHMEEIIVLDGDITIPISEWKLRMEADAAETSD